MAPSSGRIFAISALTSLKLLLVIICFSLQALLLPPCALAHNPQFSFPTFHPNEPSLVFSNNSNVDNQALQVTRNSGSRDISNTSGQITYTQPLQLWHDSHDYTASFNTSFLLNMGKIDGNSSYASGGGMTFMLSSLPAILHLPNSHGPWLGLIDSTPSSEAGSQFVAIELDTFKDSFDPDGNHVGIDANASVNSLWKIPLSPLNVTLTNTSDLNGIYTSVWIDYDGNLFTFDVYLANQGPNLSTKPAVPIISGYINLREYLPRSVYVGFSASVGTILESHCVLQWYFNSTGFPDGKPNIAIIVTCSVGGAALIILVILLVLFLARRRRRHKRLIEMEDLTNLHYGPQKFEYKVLKKATNGFSEQSSLGHGGFGAVYKGVLRAKNGITTEVAVKCLSQKSKQGEKEFKAEVMSMGRMRHKNLVQLLGWSYGSNRLMLVYEYLPNRSLDRWIGQRPEEGEVMGWTRRFHVMKGLAAGLLYLHEEWEMVVIHRDLKPSNVMLDADFNARIGDFGLAKLIKMEQESAQTATIAGTFGYMAPESIEQGIISKETDIYSLGAIAIELATGHRISIDFLHTLARLLEDSSFEEAADPQLSSYDPNQLELLLRTGLACCHPHPPVRPSIREVVHTLSMAGSPRVMGAPSLSSFSSSYASSIPRMPITDSSIAAMEVSAGR